MNVEYSLGPFCNWFLPSCLDIWSSADGQRVLCSYGARSMVCLLNVNNRKTIKAYDCLNVFSHKSFVSVTRFHKTNQKKPLLFIGSGEGEAAIVDCFDNDITLQKNKFEDLILPSKKILAAVWSEDNDNPIVYYSLHSVVIRWNIKTDSTDVLRIGENCRNKIAISCITSTNLGRKKLAIGYMNGDITVVYLDNISVPNACSERTLSGHNDDICSLCFGWSKGLYEEGVLASVSRDGFVKVWDVIHTNNIADIKLDAMKSQHKNWFALSFVPNSRSNEKFQILIGSGTGELLSIEVPNKPPDSKIRIHKPMSYMKSNKLSHNSVVFSIAIDLKNMFAITSSLDHQIIVWDLTERKGIDSYYTATHGVHDISVSPIDPSRVAIAIGDGVHVIKFDEELKVVNQRRIYFPKTSKSRDSKCFSVVWHPDCENRLAFGTSAGDITVIDLNSSQKIPKYMNKKSSELSKIYGLIWGPSLEENDESTLYSVHSNGKLYLHYISSNLIKDFTDYIKEDIKRSEIMWKTNYKHFSIGNDCGTVDVFQYQNYKLDFKVRIESFSRAILCLRWNSIKDEETSNWLAVSSYDGSINCYSLHNFLRSDQSLEESKPQTITKPNRVLRGHSERVTSMSWCPYDSNKLVSVSYDKTAQVWDVLKETPLKIFSGHRGILYCVLWSLNDPDLIFSGGEDNYFHIWRPSKQNEIKSHEEFASNGKDYWPHLEEQFPTDGEKCVSNLLNDCINKVISDQNTEPKVFHNGFDTEEDFKRQKASKNKNKTIKKKANKDEKRISLLPLSNSIENSSTKYQKIEDIEALFKIITGKEVSEDRNERILLYGNCEDIKKFVENEVSNHIKQGNKEPKDILSLLFDIKSTIEESIQQNETNPYFVSLSMSVSRNHWKESTILLAKQLLDLETEIQTYRFYRLEMSAILLLSQNRVKEAIDLLVSSHLFREALIACKSRMNSESMSNYIINEWAKYRKQNNDFEGAAKCLTAIKKFSEAADLLTLKNDQQFDHTISLFRSFNK